MAFHNILVPTDFSEAADEALKIAVEIAERSGAVVTLLHIVAVPGEHASTEIPRLPTGSVDTSSSLDDVKDLFMAKMIERVEGNINARRELYPKIEIKEHVIFDEGYKKISASAEAVGADLIIMCTKGSKSKDGGWGFISNTQTVVRTAKCPVLAIKGKVEPRKIFREIIYASNFEESSSAGIETLKFLQLAFSSTLHLVKVITRNNFEPSNETIKLMNRFAVSNKLENYTVNLFNHYSEGEGIVSFANQIDSDLVSMSTHGRTGFQRWMIGSLTEEMVNYSDIAILSFQVDNEKKTI